MNLVIEWLSWLYESSLINSYILETSKGRAITLPSLKFLEQRVHELVGDGSTTPQTTLQGAKGLDQEGLMHPTLTTLPKGWQTLLYQLSLITKESRKLSVSIMIMFSWTDLTARKILIG